jgi:type IV pilus assembly protein PilA
MVTEKVTIPRKGAENVEFWSRRTSDFRHLGLWPSECDSTSELVIQPNQSNGDEDNLMRKQKGFSLIELLIVVAIILIIAAIAIPNLLRARIAANESSAVASIRTINTAQISYNSAYPTVGFAGLTALGGSCVGATLPTSALACLIDSQLASGSKSGYTFASTASGGTPASSYVAYANPQTQNTTGVRSFCSVADAVVRYTTASLSSCAGTETPLQ